MGTLVSAKCVLVKTWRLIVLLGENNTLNMKRNAAKILAERHRQQYHSDGIEQGIQINKLRAML